ncbi:MAG: histidinol-phosphatase [SAR324 cluster bacterium]|nr:histidinol-phosphatase [SAR324 cluster bacterium]
MDEIMQEWIDFAEELARESGKLVLGYFGTPLDVQHKADHSPVTKADQEAEALMRRMIEVRFPQHQVVGEESGTSGPAEAKLQWMLDPIDGTKSFILGVPLFCTLIALLKEGRPILGAIHIPVSGELLIGAEGRETVLNGRPVHVSGTRSLSEATVVYTSSGSMWKEGYGEAFRVLQGQARLVRGWGDGYGHMLVATGRADIMLDPILSPWDVAALKPCVEGAGGRLTDLQGQVLDLGESALSTNGHLHDEVLAIINSG